MLQSVLCTVCGSEQKKYKCPGCRAGYCSLACYKSNKEVCQSQQEQRTVEQHYIDTGTSSHTDYAHLFPTANTIPQDTLQLLSESDKLKEILSNPHLREFLLFLDSSEDKAMLMRKAMREPIFLEFVDVCLDTIEPGREKDLTDEELMKVIQDQVEEADWWLKLTLFYIDIFNGCDLIVNYFFFRQLCNWSNANLCEDPDW